MSDYTPTTEEALKSWLHAGKPSAEFHRWLAEVRADAWQEGWDTKPPYQKINNPYRQGEEQ